MLGSAPHPVSAVDAVHNGARSVENALMPAVYDQRVTEPPHGPPVPTVVVCQGTTTRTSSFRIDSEVVHPDSPAGVKSGPPKCTVPTAVPSADFVERRVQSEPPAATSSLSSRNAPTPLPSDAVQSAAPVPGASPRTWLAVWLTTTDWIPIGSSPLPLSVAAQLGAIVATFAGVTVVSSRFQPRRVAPCPDIVQVEQAVARTTRRTNGPKRRAMTKSPLSARRTREATSYAFRDATGRTTYRERVGR